MWWKKFKQKKPQFILIGIILCFTAAILSACISFTVETNIFTKKYFSYQECPILFNVIEGDVSETMVTENEDLMKLLDKVTTGNAKFYNANLYIGNKYIKNSSSYFYEIEKIDTLGYNVSVMQGNHDLKCPKDNEIWVCSVGATANDIKVGDQVALGRADGEKLTVSAIVSTPICPSGFMGVYPYYVNKNTLAKIDGVQATAINLFAKDSSVHLEAINNVLPSEFTELRLFSIEADSLIMSTSMLTTIFGGVGIIAALVVFLVSIIIIRFIIKSTLARESKMIGTYKSLGWQTTQIIGFYLKCYLFTGSIGILIGVFLGIPLADYIGKVTTKDLGGFTLTSVTAILCVFTAILLVIILVLNVYFGLKKIGKISPVQALTIGTSSSKEKFNRSLIKSASSPVATAINDIFRKRSMSIIIIFILTVSFYLSTLFCSLNLTFQKFGDNKDVWFAFPKYDCIAEIKANEEIEDYLIHSEYVKDYTLVNLGTTLINTKSRTTDIDLSNIAMFPFSKLNESVFNIPFVEGRRPSNPYEIAASAGFLKAAKLKVGDYFNIKTETVDKDLLITASYSSMYNGGKTIHITEADYNALGLPAEMEQALIFLNNKSDYEAFRADFENYFEKSDIIKELTFVEPTIKSINMISNPITSALVVIFVLFSILNIINLLLMNNIENRRQYGILKAMGFTSGYICLQSLSKTAILSAVAALLTLILHQFASPVLFYLVIGVNGLERPPLLTTTVIASMFAVIIFTTLMFALPLRKIAPTELMED